MSLLAAFYKYGDRTEIFEKSLKGTDDTLISLRREIAYTLGIRLKPVLESSKAVVVDISILDAEGHPIQETEGNPVGSEAYMDAIGDFVASHTLHIINCGRLLRAKSRWCKWARRLSWTLLGGLAMQLGIVGWLFSWAKLLGHDVPNWTLLRTLEPTAAVVLLCLLEIAVMLRSHDAISEIRNQYDAN